MADVHRLFGIKHNICYNNLLSQKDDRYAGVKVSNATLSMEWRNSRHFCMTTIRILGGCHLLTTRMTLCLFILVNILISEYPVTEPPSPVPRLARVQRTHKTEQKALEEKRGERMLGNTRFAVTLTSNINKCTILSNTTKAF